MSWCSDVVSVSFFWQSDWLRLQFLAVVLATLRECVRRSVSCADVLVFKKIIKNVNTRQSEKLVWDYKCKTSGYKKSSIPYLARLLNSNSKTKNL